MDLSTSYAGVAVSSPVLIGASPLALDATRVGRLAEAGVGAIVMPSIFEEQIADAELAQFTSNRRDIGGVGPNFDEYNGGIDGYLRSIELAKEAGSIPVIASFDCHSTGGWHNYGTKVGNAGADAIELNLFHYERDPQLFGDDIERELIDRVHRFCDSVELPVSVKLLPQFTCLPNVIFRIAGAGASGVCLFGQTPAFDLDEKRQVRYRWRLTTEADFRFTLEGIHQARGAAHNLTLAASGGIKTATDALAALRMGANVVMLTSAIYQSGTSVVNQILDALKSELKERKLLGLSELIGSQGSGFDPFPTASHRQAYSESMLEFEQRK